MDSLTQITLGAAVGEVVLGRKVGNRAIMWGAIGGTLPDLDVMANLAGDELSALAYHRGISHSFTFAVLAPAALGWLAHRIYEQRGSPRQARDFIWVGLGLFALLTLGAILQPIPPNEAVGIGLAVALAMLFFPGLVWMRERFRRRPPRYANAGWRQWSWLFFWAIFTHPLLDSCTSFGTQLFQPFWDYRVTLDNISVVDPIYSLPFMICVIIVSALTRQNPIRRIVNWVGIGLSSAYLLYTFNNKYRVEQIFRESLEQQAIPYRRFTTTPTLLNNVLWQGVAEGPDTFYYAMYSFMDEEPVIPQFQKIPKRHDLLTGHEQDRSVRILRWFSKGYYALEERPDGTLLLVDLRFGAIRETDEPEEFIFKFILEDRDGEFVGRQPEQGGRRDLEGALESFAKRIRGR